MPVPDQMGPIFWMEPARGTQNLDYCPGSDSARRPVHRGPKSCQKGAPRGVGCLPTDRRPALGHAERRSAAIDTLERLRIDARRALMQCNYV